MSKRSSTALWRPVMTPTTHDILGTLTAWNRGVPVWSNDGPVPEAAVYEGDEDRVLSACQARRQRRLWRPAPPTRPVVAIVRAPDGADAVMRVDAPRLDGGALHLRIWRVVGRSWSASASIGICPEGDATLVLPWDIHLRRFDMRLARDSVRLAVMVAETLTERLRKN